MALFIRGVVSFSSVTDQDCDPAAGKSSGSCQLAVCLDPPLAEGVHPPPRIVCVPRRGRLPVVSQGYIVGMTG